MALTAIATPVTTGAGAVAAASLNGSPSCTSTGYPIHPAAIPARDTGLTAPGPMVLFLSH